MNQDFLTWLPIIKEIAIPVIGLVLGWAGLWLKKKFKSEAMQNSVDTLANLAYQVTNSIAQTYVDAAQRRGKWDDTAKKEAKNMAVDSLKSLAKEKGLGAISDLAASIAIESAVRDAKPFEAPLAPAPVSQP